MADGRVVEVQSLEKAYGSRRVLDGISFAVAAGEIFALLGPNGAGKTTTIEILAGYRRADRGTVRVLGLDPARDAAELRARMGIMLQEGGVPPGLRVREILSVYAAFYADPMPVEELLARVGLTDRARQLARSLSGGERQRLSLAMALVGKPQLAFLDEPTAGMDASARRTTWAMIRDLAARGTTILLTTHYLAEAEELANRVAILDGGRLAAVGEPAALVAGAQHASFTFATAAPFDVQALARALGHRIEQRNGAYVVDTAPSPDLITRVASQLEGQGILMTRLHTGGRSLEDVFLQLTGSAGVDD